MMIEAFVYIWFDGENGKRYIGVHKGSPEDGYVCSSRPMLIEYTKRPHTFRRQIIYHGTWEDMLAEEQKMIGTYNAAADPMYYNQCNQFGPYLCDRTGTKHTEETRTRISAALKGKIKSVETRMRISAAAKKRKRGLMSEETKSRMSRTRLGRKLGPPSEEHRARISAAMTGKIRGPYKKSLTSSSLSVII